MAMLLQRLAETARNRRERVGDELFELRSLHFLTARRLVRARAAGSRARRLAAGAASRSRLAPDHVLVVVAVVLHRALLAERLRPADPAAVQDQRVGGAGPSLRRQRARTTAVRPLPDRPTRRCRCGSTTRSTWRSTGSPGTPSACPSTTFAVLRPTPGSLTSAVHVGGHLAAVLLAPAPAPCR